MISFFAYSISQFQFLAETALSQEYMCLCYIVLPLLFCLPPPTPPGNYELLGDLLSKLHWIISCAQYGDANILLANYRDHKAKVPQQVQRQTPFYFVVHALCCVCVCVYICASV